MSAARAGVTGGGAGRLTGESAVTVVRALRGARVWLIARRASSAKPSRPGFCGREALSGLRAVERLGCRRHTALFGQEVGALARPTSGHEAHSSGGKRAPSSIFRAGARLRELTSRPSRDVLHQLRQSCSTPLNKRGGVRERGRFRTPSGARMALSPRSVSRTNSAGIPQGAGRSWGEAPWWRRHARVAAGLSSARGGVPVETGGHPPRDNRIVIEPDRRTTWTSCANRTTVVSVHKQRFGLNDRI